jgi:hypothetical protein
MVPDTTLRLAAVLKALDEVISPAIREDDVLAKEQMELVKKSIALVIEQIPLEQAYMARDAQSDRELARKLSSRFAPDHAMIDKLAKAVTSSEAALPLTIADSRELAKCWLSLKALLEDAVSTLARESGLEGKKDLAEVMLSYSEKRNIRERAWIAATGFDPDPKCLPTIADAALRQEISSPR